MFCPKCGKDNPAENRFCIGCGGPMAPQPVTVAPAPRATGGNKTAMILLAVVVIIVVVVIAALFLTGMIGGGGASIGGQDLANAIAQGKPVECDVTMDLAKMAASSGQSAQGMTGTMTGKVKMEAPKMNMVANMNMVASGISMNLAMELRSDGNRNYMKMSGMPGVPNEWIELPSASAMGMEMDPSTIADQLKNMPQGVTMNCRLVGDIPDSSFQLPPGVTATDASSTGAFY